MRQFSSRPVARKSKKGSHRSGWPKTGEENYPYSQSIPQRLPLKFGEIRLLSAEGECHTGHSPRLFTLFPQASFFQPKLKMGKIGDRYEREAEAMEQRVIRKIESRDKRDVLSPSNRTTNQTTKGVYDGLYPGGNQGHPLNEALKSEMEYGFGANFNKVRIHYGPYAYAMNDQLNAKAFTYGSDIYFNKNNYNPGSLEGKKLLVHELTHTLQQGRGSARAIQRQPDPRHARGHAGEQSMGFSHYRREEGWLFVRGPSGSGGHGVTTGGEDGLAYNVRTKELHILDNKSLARRGNVGSATAIDPTRNLQQNLDDMIRHVESRSVRQLPYRQQILKRLRQTRAAIRNGQRIPARTQLIITNAGGRSTGVTRRLSRLGVTFRDVTVAPTPRPGTKVPQLSGGPRAGHTTRRSTPVATVQNIEIHSGRHKFRIGISTRFPRTRAVLRLSGAIIFDLILNAVAARFREHLKQKGAGKLLKKVLEDQKVQNAIEQALAKHEHLRSKGQTPYYLSLNLYEIWLGSYDRKGNPVGGLEAPAKFSFHSIGGVTTRSKRNCKLRGFRSESTYPEGVNWKHQVCSYPLMINQEAVDKVKLQKHLQQKRKEWEECVRLKNYRPGGLPSPEEIAKAEVDCGREVGYSLATGSK